MMVTQRTMLLALVAAVYACAADPADTTPPPSFDQLGIVEGFYGPPWSHADRLDIIRFMRKVGLRDYYYAPKDDPYHRERWRDPYPDSSAQQLHQLADSARRYGVRLHYAISPGGSMVYSDSTDYQALLHKIEAVADLGIADFGLFLDDVPPVLADSSDQARFGTLGAAHAWLATRLDRDLSDHGWSLAVTPTTYTNAFGDRAYLRTLGEGVPDDVPILWTGADVLPESVTVADATEWAALIRRPPLLWDNYPVNDFARWRPFLGPLVGRSADLPAATRGILANPMNEAHLSMIPLATVARYGRSPHDYDPDVAWQYGITRLFGAETLEALRPVRAVFGDYAWDENVFEPLFLPADSIHLSAVNAALDQLHTALTSLRVLAAEHPATDRLADELAPFVERAADRVETLRRDTAYTFAEGVLRYRTELDRISFGRDPDSVAVDGALDEWRGAVWRSLRGPGTTAPTVAFAGDDLHVYVALRVSGARFRPGSGDRIGTGDHVAVIVERPADQGRKALWPQDLWIVQPAPGDSATDARTFTLNIKGFIAKYLADNERLTISEFLLSSLGVDVDAEAAGVQSATQRTRDGYTAELALPRPRSGGLRISLTVAGTASGRRTVHCLSYRCYPGDPITYVELTERQ